MTSPLAVNFMAGRMRASAITFSILYFRRLIRFLFLAAFIERFSDFIACWPVVFPMRFITKWIPMVRPSCIAFWIAGRILQK